MSDRVGLTLEQVARVKDKLALDLIPFDDDHAEAAQLAWRRFGKGRHPAGLNFADCMSYATASLSGETLLFVGDDFSQTDVAPA